MIKPIHLGINIETEAIKVYLAQILTDIDENTKRLRSPDEKWERIKGILQFASSSINPFFLVFPEVSIPYTYAKQAVDFIRDKFPPDSITVLGIELIQVKDCKSIVRDLSIQRQEINRVLESANNDKPVNPCLIIIKQNYKCRYFLQLKITPSKYEGTLDDVENLLDSNFIYYFKSKDLNFIVLICSDFFNMRTGLYTKIIDEIDYGILKKGEPLDFIINIQHNPSPDHHLFLHSLGRVYDDGYKGHGDLCVIFLNSILSGVNKGGLSKILFYKERKIPEKQPLKQIGAPVVGYEFPENEVLIGVFFDRLPKSWDDKRDFVPLHYDFYEIDRSECKMVKNKQKYPIYYITPTEKEASLTHDSYQELALRLSNLGNFDKAIEWAKKAQDYYNKRKEFLNAAKLGLFIAIQYRHKGECNNSLQNYAVAESVIRRIKKESPKSKITLWRIEAGRVMVKDYLINGDCKRAYREYNRLIEDIVHYLQNRPKIDYTDKKELELYKIHAIRQQAEMLRIVGDYNKALKLFRYAYKQYNYIYAEEKAYSALGQGDSLRMLGKFSDALKKYAEAEEFAQLKKNNRLLARVLRNKAEVYRAKRKIESVKDCLDKLKKLSDKTNYRFGKIYYFLISGGLCLQKNNSEDAESFFKDAISLSTRDPDSLKIEHAHSLFGLAETQRLNRNITESIKQYKKSNKMYKEIGSVWGMIRTSIGLAIIDTPRFRESVKTIGKTNDSIDKAFITKLNEGNLESDEILFLNIP